MQFLRAAALDAYSRRLSFILFFFGCQLSDPSASAQPLPGSTAPATGTCGPRILALFTWDFFIAFILGNEQKHKFKFKMQSKRRERNLAIPGKQNGLFWLALTLPYLWLLRIRFQCTKINVLRMCRYVCVLYRNNRCWEVTKSTYSKV